MKTQIRSIELQPSRQSPASMRFVMALTTPQGVVFYSTSLSNETSVRITNAQIKSAFPELLSVANPMAHLLNKRSSFIGREVEVEIVVQKGKDGQTAVNPRTGAAFMQVRLLPSSADLPADEVEKLFAAQMALAAVGKGEVDASHPVNDEDLA